MNQLSIPPTCFSLWNHHNFDLPRIAPRNPQRIWLAPGHAPGQKFSERERYEKALAPEWPDVHIRRLVRGGARVKFGWLDILDTPFLSNMEMSYDLSGY